MADISLIPKDYKEKKIDVEAIFSKMGILAVILVIFSLLVYGGLVFYDRNLDSQLSDTKAQIQELDKQRDDKFESKVRSLDVALKDSKKLLENHVYWSNIISKIEEIVVPQVSFSDFKGVLEEDDIISVIFNGKTSSYTNLAKQMQKLDQEKLVSGLQVSGISLSTEGGIEFGLTVLFVKDILLK